MTALNAQDARATVRVDKVSHFFGEAVRATRCCSTTASRLKRVTMSRPPRSTKTPAGSWSICLRSVSNSRILGSRTPRFCPVQPHNQGDVNMFQHSYPVLLVDDDPDVLSVSKLALRSMTVFGVPLNVSAASSKAEAIEMLDRRTTGSAAAGSPVLGRAHRRGHGDRHRRARALSIHS